jgi:hypothetical protein
MLRCQECEYFSLGRDGSPKLSCDPFTTIKESECLLKWQLIQLNLMARSHQATLEMYQRLAPIQEKMFRQMEREIDESESADQWKYTGDDDDEDDKM